MVAGDGLLNLLLVEVHQPHADPGVRLVAIEIENRLVGLQGGFGVVVLEIGIAEGIEQIEIFGRQLPGAVEGLDRRRQLSLLAQRFPEQLPSLDILRHELGRLAQQGERHLIISGLQGLAAAPQQIVKFAHRRFSLPRSSVAEAVVDQADRKPGDPQRRSPAR